MSNLIEITASGSVGDGARHLVLFIPGLGGQPDQWSWVIPELLASGIDIGHVARVPEGRNERGRRIYTVIEAGTLLANEVEDLGHDHVHLVAHSVGSFVALEALNARPDLFAGTLLVNGGLTTIGRFLEKPVATFITNVKICSLAVYLFMLVGVPTPAALRKLVVRHRWLASVLLGRIVGSQALESREVRRLLVSNGGHIDIFAGLWHNRREWSHFLEIAPSIDSPVHFLVGDSDGLAGVRDTTAMVGLLPNASMAVLHGTGHAAPLEAPDAVTTEIVALMSEQDRG